MYVAERDIADKEINNFRKIIFTSVHQSIVLHSTLQLPDKYALYSL